MNVITLFDPDGMQKVTSAIARAIELSVWGDIGYSVESAEAAIRMNMAHPHGGISRREAKRRFEICMRVVETMRADLNWSVPRIVDTLSFALRCELDGGEWIPKKDKGRWATSSIC